MRWLLRAPCRVDTRPWPVGDNGRERGYLPQPSSKWSWRGRSCPPPAWASPQEQAGTLLSSRTPPPALLSGAGEIAGGRPGTKSSPSGRRGGAAPTQDPQGAGLPAAPETPTRRGRAKLGCGERAHAARSPPAVLPAPPRGWQLSALGVRAPCPPRPRAPPGRLRPPTPQRRKPPQPHRAKGTHGISHAASRAGEPRGLWTEVASRRAPRRQLRSQETRQPSKRWAGRCRAPAEELDSLQLGPRAPTLVPRPSSMH